MNYKDYCNDRVIVQMASEVSRIVLSAYNLTVPLAEVLKWSWSIGFVRDKFLSRDPNSVRFLADELKSNTSRLFVLKFRSDLFNPYTEIED